MIQTRSTPRSAARATVFSALFWLTLALALTMALLQHPPALPIDWLGDKFAHMLAFATLTVLAKFAFPGTPAWRIAERLSFLGALIEVAQSIPALHRDCDIRDWIADTLAIVAVTLLLRWWRGDQLVITAKGVCFATTFD
ncbi:hypothetical protein [Novosphingobium sp.]|uniref:hypothetical protein n=1 Tax=Novosphingobium sp. TaxID=1874826 RepID=UPI00333E6EA0